MRGLPWKFVVFVCEMWTLKQILVSFVVKLFVVAFVAIRMNLGAVLASHKTKAPACAPSN
jgi:hypothetical protein